METVNEVLRENGKEGVVPTLGQFDDMGCYDSDLYEKNLKAAKKAGFTPCQHCAKGIKNNNGWAIMSTGNQTFVKVAYWNDAEYAEDLKNLCYVGPTCGINLCSDEYRVKISEVQN